MQAGGGDVVLGAAVDLGAHDPGNEGGDAVGQPAQQLVAGSDVFEQEHLPVGAHDPGYLPQPGDGVGD